MPMKSWAKVVSQISMLADVNARVIISLTLKGQCKNTMRGGIV